MRVYTKYRNGRNPLVVVKFEDDENFNPDDLTWVPRKPELREIYREMKRANAWK